MFDFSPPRTLAKLAALAAWRKLAAAIAIASLAGCAWSPGISMGDSAAGIGRVGSASSASTTSTSASTPAAAATQTVANTSPSPNSSTDAPPPGALRTITPELIRQQRALQATDVAQGVKDLFGVPQPYRMGPGDVLNIVVWDHPELAIAPAGSSATLDSSSLSPVGNGYNISPAGLVQFPFVGNLKLGGLTEYEARDLLATRLAKFFKDPQVTVRIQSYRSGRVYVDGEVRTPGLQAVNDIPMTLPEAINRAGGFTALADRSAVTVTRQGATVAINLQELTAFGINPTRILLGSGDLVRVLSREESKVYVMGEVTRPVAQTLRSGRLTLNEALGEAGGVSTLSGDPRQIYVVRSVANGGQPEIFHLDARSPVAYALSEGFELKSRDVVYVDPVPLVRWNRVISLILPSAAIVNTTSAIGK